MDNPTSINDILPYLIHLLAPYLLSGPILSHALEQIPFFLDPPDKEHPEGRYPDWLQISAVYGICLALVVINNALSGVYASGLSGTVIQSTFASSTAFMATTTLAHLSAKDFFPSLGKWFSNLFSGAAVLLTKVLHPATVAVKTETTVAATDQATGQVLTGVLESGVG